MENKIYEVSGADARAVVQVFKAVATDEGALPLHEIHQRTLQAIAEHVFHTPMELETIPSVFGDALESVADESLRREVVHMASVLPYLETDDLGERGEALGRLAKAWGISDLTIKGALALAKGHKTLLYLDSFRTNKPELGQGVAALSWGFLKSSLHLDGDPKELARYESYRDLPAGTFGRTLVAYYDDNRFPLPGTVGTPFSNNLTAHDRHHVLAGYDTTPLGELCVFSFDGALSKADYSGAMIGVVAQFQLGYVYDPTVRAWRHQFDPDMVYRAAERGHACQVNYLDESVDLDALMEKPLREVREEFGIPHEGALVRGPEDRWCGEMGPVDEREDPDIAKEGLLKFS